MLLLFLTALCASAVVIPVPPSCTQSATCTSALNAAISSCSGQSECLVQLEEGVYSLEGPLRGQRILVNGASNLTVAGRGTGTVLLSDIAAVFQVSGGSNFTLASLAFDMPRLPFTYGQVTAVNASTRTSTVTFDALGLYPVDTAAYPWLAFAHGVLSYDPVLQRPTALPDVTDVYSLPPNELPVTYLSTASSAAQLTLPLALPLSQWVIVRHQTYAFNGLSATGTTGFTMINVSMWALGGMGVYCDQCKDITIDGLSIAKQPGRPMSITADGVHFSNSRGGYVRVLNSLFEGQGDDGINTPTLFSEIVWLSADRSSMRVEGRGAASPQPPPSSVLNVFNRTTLAKVGQVSVTRVGSNNTIALAAPLPQGSSLWSLVSSANVPEEVLVHNCVFRNNRARGALLKASNVTATNNTFDGCSGPAVKTESDGCYWFEGLPVHNWTLAHNTITSVNYGTAQTLGDVVIDSSVPVLAADGSPTATCRQPVQPSPAVQSDVALLGNVFVQCSGRSALAAYSVQGLALQGNSISSAAGVVQPGVDLLGAGVTEASVGGNVCPGRAGGVCVTQGLN